MQKLLVVIQVEKRVLNRLAAAHEQGLISRGCTLHLTVTFPKGKTGQNLEEVAPTIKLQLVKEGKKIVDTDVGNHFVPEDKLFVWRKESEQLTTRERKWIWRHLVLNPQDLFYYSSLIVMDQSLFKGLLPGKKKHLKKNLFLVFTHQKQCSWRTCWLDFSVKPHIGNCVIKGRHV